MVTDQRKEHWQLKEQSESQLTPRSQPSIDVQMLVAYLQLQYDIKLLLMYALNSIF